jgi:hypothetical protein
MANEFRSALNNYCLQSEYREALDDIRAKPNGYADASKLLGMWYLEQVYDELSLSSEDFKEAWTDGSGDLGCDFIYRDAASGRVYILQAKCRDEGKAEGSSEFMEFFQILEKLQDKDGEWSEHASDAIREAVKEISWETDDFICIYLTTAKADVRTKKVFQVGADKLAGAWPRAEFRFIFDKELNGQYLASLGEISQKTVVINTLGLLTADDRCTVAILSGRQLIKMYEDGGDHALFASNIRLGMSTSGSKINRGIEATVKEEPHHFFYFNNGLTCTATSVKVTGDDIDAVGLQVINGAQSLTTFYKTAQGLDEPKRATVLDELKVLVRVIESKDRDFLENVITFVNKQNPTHTRDFKSREPIIRQFAEVLQKNPQAGKIHVLDYRRGVKIDSGKKKVKVTDFVTRALYYTSNKPYEYGGSVQALFDDKFYWEALTGSKVPVKNVADSVIRERVGMWWISEHLSEYLAGYKAKNADYRCIARSVNPAIFTARVILFEAYGEEHARDIFALASRGNFSIEANENLRKMLDRLVEITAEALLGDVRMDKTVNGATFQENEWRRSEKTFDRLLENTLPNWNRLEKEFPFKTLGYLK